MKAATKEPVAQQRDSRCNGATLSGTWLTTAIEGSDEEHSEALDQPFIRIGKRGAGRFRVGLVAGVFRGRFLRGGGGERLEFDWEGDDEDGYVLGNGWAEAAGKGVLKGEIRDISGNWAKFRARRVKAKGRGGR